MKIEINNNTLIIRVENEFLDHHNAKTIREKADIMIHENDIEKVVFDFTSVGFMDSSGIGAIMGRYRLMEAVGGKVLAFGINNRIRKIIDMSGIDGLIKICKDEKQCMEVK